MTFRQKLTNNAGPLGFSLLFMLASSSSLLKIGVPWLVFLAGAWLFGLVSAWLFLRQSACFWQTWKAHYNCLLWSGLGFLLGVVMVVQISQEIRAQNTGMDSVGIFEAEGRLVGDAMRSEQGWRAQVVITTVRTASGIQCTAEFLAMVYFSGTDCLYAGTGVVLGQIRIKAVENRAYAWSISAKILATNSGSVVENLRAKLLQGCEQALANFSAALHGFVVALLFGRQDELDPDMQRAFYRSGCAHLVALSGMHIALVAALLVRLLRPWGGIVVARCGGFIGAGIFIWLVGPFPSAIRALVMFGIFQVGALLGRRYSGIATLCLTGPILGLINPTMPLNLGFQLSFWALLGIMLWQDSLHSWLRKPLLPLISMEISTGVSAQLCTAPLLWARGLALYPQGILAGIILAPLVLLFMAGGLLALVIGLLLGPSAATVLQFPLNGLYGLILTIGSLFAA